MAVSYTTMPETKTIKLDIALTIHNSIAIPLH